MTALLLATALSAHAGDFTLKTDYRNLWLSPNPSGGAYSNYFGAWPSPAQTNASTLPFSGHVLGNTNSTAPSGGDYRLVGSKFGQTVEGIQSDVSLGEVIPPPDGANTNVPPLNFVAKTAGNRTNAYYECTDPVGGAFWAPSTHKVYAAQPNNVEIHWKMLDGTTNIQVVSVDAVPFKRPARLFWTEDPYDAPKVTLDGLFPVLHYNSEVPAPVYEIVTNVYGDTKSVTTNVTSGIWVDSQKQLHGIGVSGMLLLEYYKEGSYSAQVEPDAIEIVEVLEPEIATLFYDIGERLMPVDTYWSNVDGNDGVYPQVQRGINDTVYVNAMDGPKDNWAYAIKKTIDAPWSIEIYWEHKGLMNVDWPYEVDWYSCDWPKHPQQYVIAEDTQYQARVLIPDSLSAQLMPFMEPDLHAHLSTSAKAFYADQPGFSLIKYTTSDDIWFDVVHSIYHDDSNFFDLEYRDGFIGDELYPPLESNHALAFDGVGDFVNIADLYVDQQTNWSLAMWFMPLNLDQGTLFSQGSPDLTFKLSITNSGAIYVSSYCHDPSTSYWRSAQSASGIVEAKRWHYLTASCRNSSPTGGLISIYLDGISILETNMLHLIGYGGTHSGKQTVIGAAAIGPAISNNMDFLQGRIDQVRIWNTAHDPADLWSNRYLDAETDGLLADFPFDEGSGDVVHNNVSGGKAGSIYGTPRWTLGNIMPHISLLKYPGYLYTPEGTAYNINRYDYPTETNTDATSHIFAVNEGNLEVWWANRSRQISMPEVYYPSYVARYTCTWPTNSPEIVIASGYGSTGIQPTGSTTAAFSDGSIYVQNDSAAHGYNPNEEHALILGGIAYALRDDLNTSTSSAPYVLVDCLDPDTARIEMRVFHVLRTNEIYQFEYPLEAGLPIEPPMPLGGMPLCTNTYSYTVPPAWQDRKKAWWAQSAGDNGGTNVAQMHFYYQMQETFWFPDVPESQQPEVGVEIPWLPLEPNDHGLNGTPLTMDYDIYWPENPAEMSIAQTLTEAYHDLPDMWDQLSVEILYQQSQRNGQDDCVTVFDPVVARGVDISPDVINALIAVDRAERDTTDSKVRFPVLSPSLYPRIYFDPNQGTQGKLMIIGERVETLTGTGYLLLNCLSETERELVRSVAKDTDVSADWNNAVNALPGDILLIEPNVPYVNAALYAGLGTGSGYVTLAFNNSTNETQVPKAEPVSLNIIKVIPELWSGELEVIEPDNVLDEQLSLRPSPDFAGRVDDFTFQWRWAEPEGGLIPNTNFLTWSVYGLDMVQATNEVTIAGASPFTLRDDYFAVRYRMTSPTGVTGTNWSEWIYNLAPGWVQRVMNGINPFQQCYDDKVDYAVDTRSTMIQMAGPPYEGDVALNKEAACEGGLIPLYQTVMNRAASFSIDAGISDSGNNETLLYAASRLHDLYMLLGNEAYADAMDPSIAFPRSLYEDEHGADATSIFCFMNQEPNLLEEELALLRGRDNTLEPSVETSPIYNRLIWNFTAGINGGEAAYAYNYNIVGTPTTTVGTITVEDAKRLFPQGHGDAWGHYLSANAPYMRILSNTNFVWQTEPGATLVGNATVSTDFMDEQKFAEGAAAKARAGVEILDHVYREYYSENAYNCTSLRDTDTNRAWGVTEWASRAGQAAYYDWALANSLMLYKLTNMTQVGGSDVPPEGIQKIDRVTTPELKEIVATIGKIQATMDNADGRLNPLGLARNVVPFDISPSDIDAGETHFEQIYDRAVQAVYNACIAYDFARSVNLRMREQFDSLYDLEEQLAANETDYHNRLIAIYGYPYADDIGPTGTYPQGYNGPDLINWQIIDLDDLVIDCPTGEPITIYIQNYDFIPGSSFTSTDYKDYEELADDTEVDYSILATTTVYLAENGLKIKPSSWTGSRQAEGELQKALRDYVGAWYDLQAANSE